MSTFEMEIGDTGEVMVVTGQWDPDPEVLKAELFKMANEFDDWSVPMADCREILMRNERRRFSTETDPDGLPWQELSDRYWWEKVEVGGFPDEILVRSTKMRTAATSADAWFITERAIFFNVEVLPKDKKGRIYGAAHQAGATIRHGAKLPQRAFIGMDDEAIDEIEAVFLAFIKEKVEDPWVDAVLPPGEPFVITTTGLMGTLEPNALSLKAGFTSVRGAGGRFIGHVPTPGA